MELNRHYVLGMENFQCVFNDENAEPTDLRQKSELPVNLRATDWYGLHLRKERRMYMEKKRWPVTLLSRAYKGHQQWVGGQKKLRTKVFQKEGMIVPLAERQVSGAIIAHWLSIGVWVSVWSQKARVWFMGGMAYSQPLLTGVQNVTASRPVRLVWALYMKICALHPQGSSSTSVSDFQRLWGSQLGHEGKIFNSPLFDI